MSADADERTRRADRLIGLFPRPIAAYELQGEASEADLHELEAKCYPRAIEKRRLEFAGGRLCARRALADLEVEGFPLVAGPGRAPVWPGGIVGSITHAEGYCGAVAVSTGEYEGIGVDVEVCGRLGRDLESRICTPEEKRWLDSQPSSNRAESATLIFSAKEALYKCQYCITGAWLGFLDVTLEIEAGSFEVHLVTSRASQLEDRGPIRGRYHLDSGLVFAGIGL